MGRGAGILAVVAIAAGLAAPADAQFGQNKVTYDTFDWKVYQSPHFDVHYYDAEAAFLEDIVSYAESVYVEISRDLDHELRHRIPLVVYKTHQEFRQTNITMAELPEGVMAFAEPIQNRMVLPIDQPPDKLYDLISHELVHIFQYSIFFEGNLGRALRSSPPRWLFEGMASYLAKDEDNVDRMVLRDAVVNNIIPPVQQIDYFNFLAYRYGHALFDFIEEEHGIEGFRNFVYEYRKVLLSNNLGKAVKDTFGYDLDEFNRRYQRFLRRRYFPVLMDKGMPDDFGKRIAPKRQGRPVPTFSPALSPSGELLAAFGVPKQDLDLLVLSADDGSVVRNLTKGWTTKYENLVVELFDGKRDVAWSPTGDEVAVFAKRENLKPLFLFDALSGKMLRRIDLPGMYETASPVFSPDGKRIAFEANSQGIVDLFEYDVATGDIRNLTADEYFDANPWYSADGRTLLYNRRIGEHWKVFQVEVGDPSRKTQITFGTSSDIQPTYSRDGDEILFSSDRDPNGVFNIYGLDLASGEVRQYTDVVGGCFSPVEMAPRDGQRSLVFTAYYSGSFSLYRMPLGEATGGPETPAEETEAPPDDRSAPGVPGSEAETFEPPMRLSLDEEDKRDYKLKWDIESPSVSIGIADDGTFLTNSYVRFADLLGDHRVDVSLQTVSTFSNIFVRYLNLRRRLRWGGTAFDFRDYYVTADESGVQRDSSERHTGGEAFVEYPINRYYRVEAGGGFIDRSQSVVGDFDGDGDLEFFPIGEQFVTLRTALVGDTTRFQFYGPMHGHRFRLGAYYGINVGGDTDGNASEFRLDWRNYLQATARSNLAWRFSAIIGGSDRPSLYSLGGVNQLRGYDYREFFGSSVVYSNLEYRFPLIDALQTPIGAFGPVRAFVFFDVGAAWLQDRLWWDPDLQQYRGLVSGQDLPFECWDSENGRLQDCRASYGFGLQFYFAGLQWNWSWASRLPYTQYVREDPFSYSSPLVPVENDGGDQRMDFYIIFDF